MDFEDEITDIIGFILWLYLVFAAYNYIFPDKYTLFVYNDDMEVTRTEENLDKKVCLETGKLSYSGLFECGKKCREEFGRTICEETIN
jgi:hypothetical protein